MRNFFYLIILFASCTEELDMQLNTFNPVIVTECIYSPESGFEAYFSHTVNITQDFSNSMHSRLELYENDSLIHEAALDTNYWDFKYNARYGCTYQLIVTDLIGRKINGSFILPKPVYILNPEIKVVTKKTRNDSPAKYENNATFSFIDPNDETNYYQALIYSDTEDRRYWSSYYTEDPVLLNEGDIDYGATTLFFSDELFNGEKYTISVYSVSGGGAIIQGVLTPDACIIEFRSITKEYYMYLKYLTRHVHNQQLLYGDADVNMLFLGEPIDMYTNIENGYGIFTGYSSNTRKFNLIPSN